jgi:CubicO group peptidase (beta-lactamase class C family)
MMVGVAQQEGFLSINDTTSKYIGKGWTNCSVLQEDKITIRNQLSMTSGLDDGVADPYCTIDTCLIFKANAGTRWAYHNAPYTLLDSVIESATGQSLNTYTSLKLKNPTGMTGAFLSIGFNNTYYSTARSMARFGLLMQNNGVWNVDTLLYDTVYLKQMLHTSQEHNLSYGYLWWLNGKTSFMVPSSQFVFNGSLCPNAPTDLVSAVGYDRRGAD